jgi:hypothetical protein
VRSKPKMALHVDGPGRPRELMAYRVSMAMDTEGEVLQSVNDFSLPQSIASLQRSSVRIVVCGKVGEVARGWPKD